MSLTQQDLLQIEAIFDKKLTPLQGRMARIEDRLDGIEGGLSMLEGKLEALESDVKEIYSMISDLRRPAEDTNGLSIEEKIRRTHEELLLIAKQAGVRL